MFGKKPKSQVRRGNHANPVETVGAVDALGDFGQDVVKTVKSNLTASGHDMWAQLLGTYDNEPYAKEKQQLGGDLVAGKEISLTQIQAQTAIETAQKLDILPGIDYQREIVHGFEVNTREENREMRMKIQEVMIELKRLVDSSQILEIEFKDVATDQTPINPGKYHINFFEWLLAVIRTAREKVEDSGAWLATLGSKKKKRQYWSMFKKHGTTFGLSNERVVSTQTG